MQRKWQVLLVVCAAIFMASLDLFIVNIAFPDIALDFPDHGLSALSWVLNAYAIVFAALLVPAGRWADAIGRRRLFLLGLGVFVAASAACAAAPSLELLVAARIVQAAGAALVLPTSLGLLLPEFPPAERPVAIGIWAAISGVAAASGPVLGGLLVQADWRLVFLVNLPVGLVALGFGVRILREIREPGALRPDVPGIVLLAAGVGALVVAIVQGQEWGWGSAAIVGLFAAAAVALAAVARRSTTHPAPVVEPALVAVRSFRLAVLASTAFFAAFAAMLLGSVLFLTQVWGEDVLHAGLMVAPGPLAAALSSVPGARLGARFGHRAAGVAGALCFGAGGLWWHTMLGDGAHYATDYLPGMIIGGIGVGLSNPTFTGAAAAAIPAERFATGIALLTTGRQLGSAIGVAVLVAVLGPRAISADAFDGGWAFMVGCAVVAGGLMALLRAAPAPQPAAPAAVGAPVSTTIPA